MAKDKAKWLVVGYAGQDRVVLTNHPSEESARQQRDVLLKGGIEGYDRLTVEESERHMAERTRFDLKDMERRTPKVGGVEAMRNSLQLALFGAVSERDVVGMAEKLKEMALAGDFKAMKLFFSLVQGPAQSGQVVSIQNAVVELQATVAQIQQAVVTPRPGGSPPLLINGHAGGEE